jgi:hypothetical protein
VAMTVSGSDVGTDAGSETPSETYDAPDADADDAGSEDGDGVEARVYADDAAGNHPRTCDDIDAGLVVPRDFPTIQAAIDVSNVATICVEPGEYHEHLVIRGEGDPSLRIIGVGGPFRTIIDGDNEGVPVWFEGPLGASNLLKGFTLRRGNAHDYLRRCRTWWSATTRRAGGWARA